MLLLDDLDPFRDRFDAPAADRLGAEETDARARRFAEAWSLLADAVPGQAAEAARTLTTLTPLSAGAAAPGRHGPGALGVGRRRTREGWRSACSARSAGRNCGRSAK